MTLPDVEVLVERLNAMIAVDERPAERRDGFSRRSGLKRTRLESVGVVPLQAGALAVSQKTQTTVANMGNAAWGKLAGGPLTAESINQGNLSDCYLLIAMYLIARLRPNFFDDIFIKLDDQTAVVQWFYGGAVLQIKTSLLVSTDYDHPANGDVRPELAEKTWCLIKAGLSDYAADNFGLISSVFTAFGLDGSLGTPSADAIIAAMQAGKAVGLQTTPTASGKNSLENWVESHAYGAVDFDLATKNLTLVQPWYAVKQIPGVDPATVSGGKIFNLAHVGAFPAAPRIVAGMVNLAADPAPVPVAPAVVPVAPLAPVPIAVGNSAVTIGAGQCSTMVNCQLETQPSGKVDIGYVSGAAYVEYVLNVAAAGTYTLTLEMAAIAQAEMDISVNGVLAAVAVAAPLTAAWTVFANVQATVSLPAGAATLRFANKFGTQFNIGNVTVSPGGTVADDPVVSISVVTTRKSGRSLATAVL